MTPTDAHAVIALLLGCIGILAIVLALTALVSRAIERAWAASARHLETCMTQALQIPLYPNLEDEHRALIADRNITGYE